VTQDSLVKDTPVITKGGGHVLVTVNNRGRFAIASITLVNDRIEMLTPVESNSESPVISRDGREVLFASDRDGRYAIYAMAPDGSNQHRVTTTDADERTPDFTATPGTILVAKRGGIYQRSEGSAVQPVLSYKGDYAPRWHSR
jgi:TolB protein